MINLILLDLFIFGVVPIRLTTICRCVFLIILSIKKFYLIPFLKTPLTTIAVHSVDLLVVFYRLQEITCHWNPRYFPVSPPTSAMFPLPSSPSVSYNPLNNVQCYQHRWKSSGMIQHTIIHCSSVFALHDVV